MRARLRTLGLGLVLSACASSAFGACLPIPYCDIGQIAPTVSITAGKTGNLTGLYFGYIADFTDYVRVVDVTANTVGPWVFDNKTSQRGDIADFGFVNAGDLLVVEIWDQDTGRILASDPAYSEDGTNHAYVFGGLYINSKTSIAFFGIEDLIASEQTDWDYNDSEFFIFNLKVSRMATSDTDPERVGTPEPATLVLLGTSLLVFRRKASRS